jgi:hypothetical protein
VTPGEVGRANDARIVCQFGNAKFRFGPKPAGRNVTSKGFSNGREQVISGYRNTTTDDKDLWVQYCVQAGAGLS